MASFFEKKDRRVIPNFRSLAKSQKYGDLSYVRKDKFLSNLNDIHFEQNKEQWINLKTIGHAADLVSNGFVINPKDPIVKDAAKFILDSEESSKSLISISKNILNINSDQPQEPDYLNLFINESNFPYLYEQIHLFKNQSWNFPRNPINHLELSRLYLILGQKDQAINSMKMALYLDPHNRFVLRSAVRLFSHFGELDLPHYYLLNSNYLLIDPWILSAEIALSTLKDKRSKFIKKGLQLINSSNFSPFDVTELSSAIATVELLNGNLKKAKLQFLNSLENPNDNSLAQVEWASNREKLFDINPNDFKQVNSKFEALALDNYYNNEWDETIKNAECWFIDSPFARRPLALGFHVTSAILNNQEKAIEFCKAGLISNPKDPLLLNNVAYAFALLNKTDEAEKYLAKVDKITVESETNRICLVATQGLVNFRKGNIIEGRNLYLKAIEDTKQLGDRELNWLAILNYAREEIKIKSEFKEKIMNFVSKIPDNINNLELELLKSQIESEYKKSL